ncbi:MAG: hypothetical protein IKO27_01755 [Ruminococcus sp.]|nr:hypothetical protein [Ruminococcus sp.]
MELMKEDYLILPDEELKEQYRHDRHMLWLISLPLLVLMYLVFIILPDTVTGGSNEGIAWISVVACFVEYSFVLSDNPGIQKKLVISLVAFQLMLCAAGFFINGPAQAGLQLFYLLSATAANLVARRYIKDIAVLKEHPRYPFDNWRREDSYSYALKSDGTYEDKAVRMIEGTLNRGKVLSVGGEDYFEGDKKTYEKPAPESEPGQHFQQREQIWRPHNKDDTGYTMDNLKNMYFGSPEKGELDSRELEKLLWAETAPKKPPEPPEEDFLQQSPVIWRTNKDGTVTMERRSPGSLPAGEFDSRSVLP